MNLDDPDNKQRLIKAQQEIERLPYFKDVEVVIAVKAGDDELEFVPEGLALGDGYNGRQVAWLRAR